MGFILRLWWQNGHVSRINASFQASWAKLCWDNWMLIWEWSVFFIKGVKAWKSSFHKMGIHFLSFEQQCTAGQRAMMFIESVGKKETLNERFTSGLSAFKTAYMYAVPLCVQMSVVPLNYGPHTHMPFIHQNMCNSNHDATHQTLTFCHFSTNNRSLQNSVTSGIHT